MNAAAPERPAPARIRSVTPFYMAEHQAQAIHYEALIVPSDPLELCCLAAIHNHDRCYHHMWPIATRLAKHRVEHRIELLEDTT